MSEASRLAESKDPYPACTASSFAGRSIVAAGGLLFPISVTRIRRCKLNSMPYPRSAGTKPLFSNHADSRENPPEHYLIAHSDGGARGNPGPAGYGVVIQDESGNKVAHLSEYLGHQTNNFAEYQGLIAALEYAIQHGPKALKLISDSELLVRQIKGIYKVKNPTLKDLHARAKELIAQLEWFSIGHALREHNREADRLANEAMDKGIGRVSRA